MATIDDSGRRAALDPPTVLLHLKRQQQHGAEVRFAFPLLFISSSIYLSQFSLSFLPFSWTRARLQEPRWRRGREVVRSAANQALGFSLSPPGLQWHNMAYEEDGQEVAACFPP
jgi:hypothetical protein